MGQRRSGPGPCLLTPMNTLQAEPWGPSPTPEATRCSADPTPNSRGGCAAHKACKAGEGELLPAFLLRSRSPEVQTAKVSLESCLRPRGTTGLGLGISPHCGHLLTSNGPRRIYHTSRSPTRAPPIPSRFEADDQKNLEENGWEGALSELDPSQSRTVLPASSFIRAWLFVIRDTFSLLGS